jgi:hypothetical protein
MSTTVLLQYPDDNVAPSAATIGVNSGTEDSDYPAAYLADGRPGRPAKLTTTSGSWVFAFAAAQRIDLIALGAHNLTAATLEGNSTNAWSAPAFSAALTIPARTADGHSVNAWRDLTAVSGYAVGGFAYWRLVVSGSAPCAVGEVWLGSQVRVAEHNYRWGFTRAETHPSLMHLTEALVPHAYAIGSRQRRLQVEFQASESGATQLIEWARALRGSALGGLCIPDSTTNDAWWIHQGGDYAEVVNFANARDVSMTLVEHATGVPL